MSGPWTVGLVELHFIDDDTGETLLTRYSYHVLREGDTIDLHDGKDHIRALVSGVVWGDEFTLIYVRPVEDG